MIQHIDSYSCVVPVHDDEKKCEPLCGIYSKKCAETFLELIRKRKLQDDGSVECGELSSIRIEETLPFYNPHLFFNINTPADCIEAEQYIREKPSEIIYEINCLSMLTIPNLFLVGGN